VIASGDSAALANGSAQAPKPSSCSFAMCYGTEMTSNAVGPGG
jgi:hypothetical protein